MIHYTCDCCKRPIDSQSNLRYIVRLEVYPSLDPTEEEPSEDRDHLLELQDILEHLEDTEDSQVCEELYHLAQYDLCDDCRQRYIKNPLGRPEAHHLDFSPN